MKRSLSIIMLLALIGVVSFSLFEFLPSKNDINTNVTSGNGIEILEPKPKNKSKEQSAHGYLEYINAIRANQVTGKVDVQDVLKAREQVQFLKQQTRLRGASLGLVWEELGPDNIGGRTRAIVFDKNNPNRLYAGGVSGGLFISDNGGEAWYNYSKDDTLAGIGVAAISQAINGDIYVGTGEFFINQSANGVTSGGDLPMLGEGMWKSTDGGNTFFHLSSTRPAFDNSNAEWSYITNIETHPNDANILYAGTHRGLRKSTDGGNTWQTAGTSDVAFSPIHDIEISPDGLIYVAAGSQYFRSESTLNPDKFISGSALGTMPTANTARIKIAYAPSDPNYVYVIGCNIQGQTTLLARSTDKGANFVTIAPILPSTLFNPTGSQGWYDMEIAVNPIDKDRIYVGGQLQVYTWSPSLGWYPISTPSYRAIVDPKVVHADHHEIIFHPTNPSIMLVGTDGGIYRSKNAGAVYPDFQMLNKNYVTTQFYSVSAGIDGSVLGGTQDNSNIYIDFGGNTIQTGAFVGGGDGGFSDISKTNPKALFFAAQEGYLRRSSNRGLTYSSYFDKKIDGDLDGDPDCGAVFITPFRLWEETRPDTLNLEYFASMTRVDSIYPHIVSMDTATIIYKRKLANGSIVTETVNADTLRTSFFGEGRIMLATDCGVWIATDVLNFSTTPTWFKISDNITNASYVEYSKDGNHAFVGTRNGNLYRISGLRGVDFKYKDWNNTPDNANDDVFSPAYEGIKITQIGTFAGRYITGIAVDIKNPNLVAVSLGNYGNVNYVYSSSTALTDSFPAGNQGNFRSLQGLGTAKLPALPVYSVVIDYYNPNNVIVGTELGIYATTNANSISPQWTLENTGKTFTPNYMMRQEQIDNINSECYVLYVGTFGRGIWRSTTLVNQNNASCNTNITAVRENIKPIANNTVEVYPNPIRSEATVKLNAQKSGNIYVVIYDIMGRKVKEKYVGFVPGNSTETFKLNVDDIPNGNYILTIVSDASGQVGKKIIITR